MIPLFFSDFKRFIKSEQFNGDMLHPTLYFETDAIVTFYKPVGSFIYTTSISRLDKPEDMDINSIKIDFKAVELPRPLNTNSMISITGTLN